MKSARYLLVLLFLVVISCGNPPAKQDARAIVEEILQEKFDDAVELIKFKKLSGFEEDGHYIYEYEGTITFLQRHNFCWDCEDISVIWHEPGDEKIIEGQLEFEKSLMGWNELKELRKTHRRH